MWKDFSIFKEKKVFGVEDERDRVLHDEPGHFSHSLLVLKCTDRLTRGVGGDFTYTKFWVQMYGIPLSRMYEEVGFLLGNKIGTTLEVEKDNDDFRYERLSNFCFACGCIGHMVQECLQEEAREMLALQKFPYSIWLRGSNLDRIFHKSSNKVRTKIRSISSREVLGRASAGVAFHDGKSGAVGNPRSST
ncbi:Zinc finger, CCHC-type [Parasponia andersonii]|uniref:Zinc finger, CCHC-type n=1 Tax=Parasponia andersonii TaxID=3476 RepID=A0A2P5B2Z9_PARAD|nr:Zinc finger, CCHC-type [Parasponia andersonii]